MLTYLKRYGFIGFLKLLWYRLFTALFYPKSRLIRLPFDVRNRSNIDLGVDFTCGKYCRFEAHPRMQDRQSKVIVLGKGVQINDFVHIVGVEKVSIGDNVLIASKVFISDSNHGSYNGEIQTHPDEPPASRTLYTRPIRIEDNVWIGEFVSVLQGVTIGKGSIIGSMSVVSKSIPAYSIAVGSPAKVIKRYNFETLRWETV